MRKVFLFLVMATMCITGYAQSNSKRNHLGVRAGVNFSQVNWAASGYDGDNRPLGIGAQAEVVYQLSLDKHQGWFFETGVMGEYNTSKSIDYDDYSVTYKNLDILVPLNFMYKFHLNNGLSIYPKFGGAFGIGLTASEDCPSGKYQWGYYDDEDYAEKSGFHFAPNIAVGFEYSNYVVELGLQSGGTCPSGGANGTILVTLGYNF